MGYMIQGGGRWDGRSKQLSESELARWRRKAAEVEQARQNFHTAQERDDDARISSDPAYRLLCQFKRKADALGQRRVYVTDQ